LLDDEAKYLKPKMTVKLIVDLPVEQQDMQETREILMKTYGLRKVDLRPVDVEEDEQDFKEENIDFKDVDQLFIEGLLSVDSNGLKTDKLVATYRTLIGG
jgi:hypothetical protein